MLIFLGFMEIWLRCWQRRQQRPGLLHLFWLHFLLLQCLRLLCLLGLWLQVLRILGARTDLTFLVNSVDGSNPTPAYWVRPSATGWRR
ncbi:hypothetical protein FQZ97_937270 [compost metagenome]